MRKSRKIVEGLRQAATHAKGIDRGARVSVIEVPTDIDVRAIRERLGFSQEEFAVRFGFSIGAVRHWEQGRRYPEGPTRAYLKVIDKEPRAVEKALATA